MGAKIRVPAGQRRALASEIARIGGPDPLRACRRALGRRPPAVWSSTWQAAREIESENGLDLAALDPGDAALHDTFCKQLELRRRCPAGTPGGWLRALVVALGYGGSRSYAGLASRPGFSAYNEAFEEATGRSLAVPSRTVRVDDYDSQFSQCVEQHQDHVAELVSCARKRKLAPVRRDPEDVPF